ncbi:MAG TPA: SgcJ/EcaC family oxidoreductase [Candidatus Acidoferrales bacterium]|nr:SgcJ/EcaC family oxidoreductase [Candidatus Acidoferrales bacterium]
MRKRGIVLTVLLVVAAAGCAQKKVSIADERTAIRNAEREAVNAANAKEVERWVGVFAASATVIPPNRSVLTGKEAIQEWGAKLFESPGFALKFENETIEVSAAADLAYALTRYERTLHDKAGKPAAETGNWVAVWKKQPDGSWKCVVYIWNPDKESPTPLPSPQG